MSTNYDENEIVNKHAQAARDEILRERAKTAETKEAETLAVEINSLSSRIQIMLKQPTKYKAELPELKSQLAQKMERLDTLKGTPAPYDPRLSGGGSIRITR